MLEGDKKKQFIESPGAAAAANEALAGVGGFIKSGIEKPANFKNPRYMAASLTGSGLLSKYINGLTPARREQQMSAREQLNTIMLEGDKKKQFIESPGAAAAANEALAGVGGFIKSGIEKPANFKNPRYMAASLTGGTLAGLGGYGIAKTLRRDPNERAQMVKRIGDGHQNSLSAREELDMIRFGYGYKDSSDPKMDAAKGAATAAALGTSAYFSGRHLKEYGNSKFDRRLGKIGVVTGLLGTGAALGSMGNDIRRIREERKTNLSAREELDVIRFGIRPFFKAKYPGGPIKKYTGADAEFMARMQKKDMFPEMLRENAMKRKMAGDDFDARMQILKDKRSMK